jgi:hypothetical protein
VGAGAGTLSSVETEDVTLVLETLFGYPSLCRRTLRILEGGDDEEEEENA